MNTLNLNTVNIEIAALKNWLTIVAVEQGNRSDFFVKADHNKLEIEIIRFLLSSLFTGKEVTPTITAVAETLEAIAGAQVMSGFAEMTSALVNEWSNAKAMEIDVAAYQIWSVISEVSSEDLI